MEKDKGKHIICYKCKTIIDPTKAENAKYKGSGKEEWVFCYNGKFRYVHCPHCHKILNVENSDNVGGYIADIKAEIEILKNDKLYTECLKYLEKK